MSVEEVVAARIKANAGVSALVGTRVWQLKLPLNPTLPAIRVQLIDEPTAYHMRGQVDLTRARVQVDAYGSESVAGDPYAKVVAVSAAVNAALDGEGFVLGGRNVTAVYSEDRRVLYEGEELRLIRVTQDFTVFSKTV